MRTVAIQDDWTAMPELKTVQLYVQMFKRQIGHVHSRLDSD